MRQNLVLFEGNTLFPFWRERVFAFSSYYLEYDADADSIIWDHDNGDGRVQQQWWQQQQGAMETMMMMATMMMMGKGNGDSGIGSDGQKR